MSFVLRTDASLAYMGTIPAGNAAWRGGPGRWTYEDPSGTYAGIVKVTLGTSGGGLDAKVSVANAAIALPPATRIGAGVLRVGDDCWNGAMPCRVSEDGSGARCKKAALP